MSRRDFASESLFNIALRGARALELRLRGLVYRLFGVFHPASGLPIHLDRGLRVKNGRAIQLGAGVGFGIDARIEVFNTAEFPASATPKLVIGPGSTFGDYFHCGCVNSVAIGSRVLGGSKIFIADHSHGNTKLELAKPASEFVAPVRRPIVSRGPVSIGDDAWIGDGVIILPGSTIGAGAVIAANAVVRGTVAARTIYFGECT